MNGQTRCIHFLVSFLSSIPAGATATANDSPQPPFEDMLKIAAPGPGLNATLTPEYKCRDVEGAYEGSMCEQAHRRDLEAWTKQLFVYEVVLEYEYDPSTSRFTISVTRVLDVLHLEDSGETHIVAALPKHPPPLGTLLRSAPENSWFAKATSALCTFKVRVAPEEAPSFENRTRGLAFASLFGGPQRQEYGLRFGTWYTALAKVHGVVVLTSPSDTSIVEQSVVAQKWFTHTSALVRKFKPPPSAESAVPASQELSVGSPTEDAKENSERQAFEGGERPTPEARDRIRLGSLDSAMAAEPTLLEWKGRLVNLTMKDGTIIAGRLVSIQALRIHLEDGKFVDMLDVSEVTVQR